MALLRLVIIVKHGSGSVQRFPR